MVVGIVKVGTRSGAHVVNEVPSLIESLVRPPDQAYSLTDASLPKP